MLNRRDVIYLYNGTFTGFLSAVYDCNSEHTYPYDFEIVENGQQILEREYRHCIFSEQKAELVSEAIINKASQAVYAHLYHAFLSNLENKEMYLFEFIRLSLKHGKKILHMYNLDCPNKVIMASKGVANEAHMYEGFVRFSELENGVFYAQIEPRNNVLPLIEKHFHDRYESIPFIIHDSVRQQCVIYNGKTSEFHETPYMPALYFSEKEAEYRNLWRHFYESVEIKERHNEKCRMTHMPKRFWKFLTEL